MIDLASALFDSHVAYESVHFSYDERARFDDVVLPPVLQRAAPKRQIEFLAGRHCAARALHRLEASRGCVTRIPIGVEGAPEWPARIAGAITHSDGFAAAAVARTSDLVGLGLDAERLVSLSTLREVRAEVARPGELDALRTGELDDASVLTVVFSAKESLYKCLRHLVGHFDFHDATVVSVNHAKQAFTVELGELGELGAMAHARMTGRFVIVEDLVHTSIVLPNLA